MVATRAQNPNLPVTVEEIVRTSLECVNLGASVIHIHARGDDGRPTWKKGVFARIISGIREQAEAVIVTVSTSGRNWQEVEKRTECLGLDGGVKPDLASLTPGSLNFQTQESINSPAVIRQLAGTMRERGIKPEIDLFEPGMAQTVKRLMEEGVMEKERPYFNILFGSAGTSPFTSSILAAFQSLLPADANWGAGGIGRNQLPANAAGLAFGGHVRVGLEDNLYYDKARNRLASNQMLVERIARIAGEMGLGIATPADARQILGLS